MPIELASLIARRCYFIPFSSDKLFDVVNKELVSESFWKVFRHGSMFGHFASDWKTRYTSLTLMSEGKERTPVNIAKKYKEFEKRPLHSIVKALNLTQSQIPVELSYIVTELRSDGCVIEATSKPAVYALLARDEKCGEVNAEDIRLSGEEYLDEVFVGGLGGKLLHEAKSSSNWSLLVNDAHTREITEKINRMLEEASTSVLVMGCWLGTDFIPHFKKLKDAGVPIRIITHNPNERKGPVSAEIQKGYAEIVTVVDTKNIGTNPVFHGRALVVDNKALIGTMDLNAYSLSGEHVEFAIYTEETNTVRSLVKYFEKNFKPLNKQT